MILAQAATSLPASDPVVVTVFANSISAWFQASASVILVLVTIVYVVFTRRIVQHSAESVSESRRSVEQALRLAQEEHRRRRLFALLALRHEIEDGKTACESKSKEHVPVHLTTHTWDTMKGELAFLEPSRLDQVMTTYGLMRVCNAYYDRLVDYNAARHSSLDQKWQTQARKVVEEATSTLDALNGISEEDVDQLLVGNANSRRE